MHYFIQAGDEYPLRYRNNLILSAHYVCNSRLSFGYNWATKLVIL